VRVKDELARCYCELTVCGLVKQGVASLVIGYNIKFLFTLFCIKGIVLAESVLCFYG